jgi:hypothetical protein
VPPARASQPPANGGSGRASRASTATGRALCPSITTDGSASPGFTRPESQKFPAGQEERPSASSSVSPSSRPARARMTR